MQHPIPVRPAISPPYHSQKRKCKHKTFKHFLNYSLIYVLRMTKLTNQNTWNKICIHVIIKSLKCLTLTPLY